MAFLADREDDELLGGGDEDDDGFAAGPSTGGPVTDFFGDDNDALAFDDGGGGGDDDGMGFGDGGADEMDIDGDDEGVFGGSGGPMGGARGPTVLAPFDPSRQHAGGDGLVMAMVGDKEGGSMMLDYFDQGFKNWAGPEHWKLRRVTKKRECRDKQKASGVLTMRFSGSFPADTMTAAPSGGEIKQRKEKVAFSIDFESDDVPPIKDLFTPAPRSAISMASSRVVAKGRKKASAKAEEPKEDHLLPDDMHFTSRELLTLFLKPKFFLKMRRQRTANDPLPVAEDGEVDGQFWAQAAAYQDGMDGGFDDYDDGSKTFVIWGLCLFLADRVPSHH